MYEKIKEPIDVLVTFTGKRIVPLFFRWGRKKYKIDKVNLVHATRQGSDVLYFFNVSNDSNYFKLCFNNSSLNWTIEEVYNV